MSIADLSTPAGADRATASDDDIVVLHGISWEHYVALRRVPASRNIRMTYDRGELQIVSPSLLHERIARFLGTLIDFWTVEKNIPLQSCGMMTIRRKALKRGFEPDNCYYVRNQPRVFGKKKLNFAVDPPPDLAIDVELRSGASKIAIYESFRVPELWRVVAQQIRVLVLSAEGVYVQQSNSVCLPGFPFDKAAEVLQKMDTVGQTELVRSFRDWVHSTLS